MGSLSFADAFTLELPEGWVARERLPRTRHPGALIETGTSAYLSLGLQPGARELGEVPVEAILVASTDDPDQGLHLELELPPPQHPSGLPFARGSRPGREAGLRVHLALLHGHEHALLMMLVAGKKDAPLVEPFWAMVDSARVQVPKPWWRFW